MTSLRRDATLAEMIRDGEKTQDVSDVIDPSRICPRCHRDRLVHLKSMRHYDSRDWFKCDGCEHIFTKAPEDTPAWLGLG